MTNKCDSCRNCFADCQSQPTFIDEDTAAAENLPLDIVVECDAYVPAFIPDLCAACVNQPEHCNGEVDEEGKCPRYTDEDEDEDEDDDDDDDSEDDDFWDDEEDQEEEDSEDDDDDDVSNTLEGDDWTPSD